ncbi:MAG TPA: hypothetical protein PK324_20160, partial [Nocardioides sp.]|nr:hypothetical protein [Nocardioides sp.]
LWENASLQTFFAESHFLVMLTRLQLERGPVLFHLGGDSHGRDAWRNVPDDRLPLVDSGARSAR